MTKRAMGNLVNRYRSVLKKCHLINTFGSLAVAAILVMGVTDGEAFSNAVGYNVTRVLHKECYNGILQLRSSLCNTVQNVRQSGL